MMESLILFITQANSTACASQVKQRASNDPGSTFKLVFHQILHEVQIEFGNI
jgi:hypothetical protein